MSEVFDRIRDEIGKNDVLLFMKGTPVFPQCGFSAAVVEVLSDLGVKFHGINILVDAELRQGIKEFSQWPTIPQLYVKGEFVGGLPNGLGYRVPCFVVSPFSRGGYVTELEARYKAFERPGVAKVGAFLNSSFSGSYVDATALARGAGITADNTISQTRQTRIKYGYYVNLQQELSEDVGAFARWSWNNGQTEIMSFTDIDQSLSGGLSIKGRSWGRPDDRVGLGGAINWVSEPHRNFFAAGGLGPPRGCLPARTAEA